MKKPIIDDKYHILNAKGEKEITLQKICDIMEVPVPDKFSGIKDEIQNDVTLKFDSIKKGSYYFRTFRLEKGVENLIAIIPKAVKKGAAVVFVDEKLYYEGELEKAENPCIPVPDIIDRCGRFYSYIKELNGVKTIAVTGTCGKTTTMKLLKKTVPKKYETFSNDGNANSFMSVADHIMNNLTADKEVYIQETGAGSIDAVRKSAAMLNVDACILLNVFNHHVNEYGSVENILYDKVSFDNNMKSDGVCIVNYDDEKLAEYPFKHKVISFGIETGKTVDYRAENIKQNRDTLELDIIYDAVRVSVRLNILGMHNAYNVLAAFALCKWLDISDNDIVEGFEDYISTGIRQNYREVSGYKLLLDCYNICEDSLKANIETANNIKIGENNKKIAVITGENKLGKDSEALSFKMGAGLNLGCFSNVICVGIADETEKNLDYYGNGRAVFEGIVSTGYRNAVYVTGIEALESELRKIITPGDLILFKGIYTLDLTLAIDSIFGTGIAFNNVYYTNKAKIFENDRFTARKVKYLNGLDITGVKGNAPSNLRLPDYIGENPIYRMDNELFRANYRLRTVEFGNTVVNTGRYSFANCYGLRKVRIPGNVKIIDNGAFKNCMLLKRVIIEEGVTHIGKDAFKNCYLLRKVQIPKSVKYIDKTAFENCFFVKFVTGGEEM